LPLESKEAQRPSRRRNKSRGGGSNLRLRHYAPKPEPEENLPLRLAVPARPHCPGAGAVRVQLSGSSVVSWSQDFDEPFPYLAAGLSPVAIRRDRHPRTGGHVVGNDDVRRGRKMCAQHHDHGRRLENSYCISNPARSFIRNTSPSARPRWLRSHQLRSHQLKGASCLNRTNARIPPESDSYLPQ
jgi:hypothetical protein